MAWCIHPGIFSYRVLIWVIIASFDFDYWQPSSCSTVYKLCRSENVATYTKKPNHICTSQAALCQLPSQNTVHCLWWTVEKGLVVAWWRWGSCCWACSTDQSVGEVNVVEYPYIPVAGRWDVTRNGHPTSAETQELLPVQVRETWRMPICVAQVCLILHHELAPHHCV